jgi:hypothetical protein
VELAGHATAEHDDLVDPVGHDERALSVVFKLGELSGGIQPKADVPKIKLIGNAESGDHAGEVCRVVELQRSATRKRDRAAANSVTT